MNITIFQFSGTGNTWYVANHLQKAFETMHVSCKVMSLECISDIHTYIEDADIIGLGYPIYGSDMPEPVISFLENLSIYQNKRAFVYCTQYMFSGDGASIGAKMLRKKGFIVRQLNHFNMPNNITDYALLRKIRLKNHEKLKDKVVKKTTLFASNILQDRRVRKGEHIFSLSLGLIQRIPFRLGREEAKKALKIDETCTGCELCVQLCPSGNLKIENYKAVAANSCYLCYRCINYCPVQAIRFAKFSKTTNPYHGPEMDFNIDNVRKHQLTTNDSKVE